MPRLVHLNGPPGIGKSTLARLYVRDRPLAFYATRDTDKPLTVLRLSHKTVWEIDEGKVSVRIDALPNGTISARIEK